MCFTGCPFESNSGTCKGRPRGHITTRPHCFEPEDVESYNESVDADAALDYDLRQEEASIPYSC